MNFFVFLASASAGHSIYEMASNIHYMKKASVRDLRYNFKKIERLLHLGEEVQITKRRRIIGRLIPEGAQSPAEMPDFIARLRAIYGNKLLKVSGAELVS